MQLSELKVGERYVDEHGRLRMVTRVDADKILSADLGRVQVVDDGTLAKVVSFTEPLSEDAVPADRPAKRVRVFVEFVD